MLTALSKQRKNTNKIKLNKQRKQNKQKTKKKEGKTKSEEGPYYDAGLMTYIVVMYGVNIIM